MLLLFPSGNTLEKNNILFIEKHETLRSRGVKLISRRSLCNPTFIFFNSFVLSAHTSPSPHLIGAIYFTRSTQLIMLTTESFKWWWWILRLRLACVLLFYQPHSGVSTLCIGSKSKPTRHRTICPLSLPSQL